MSELLPDLAAEYAAAFQEYLQDASETALQRAYELGHRALTAGLRMLDLVAMHHQGLGSALRGAASPEAQARMTEAAASFLMESLSPFEMTHRGFLEANTTLRQLNRELEQQIQAVQEAARRKDEFLCTLAHELRNPLTPVANSLELLRLRGSDPGTRARAYAVMERQVHHLTHLINDLLDVSRITRGKILLRYKRVDLTALVRSSTDDHRPALTAAALTLDTELPQEPVWITGDPTRLAQVLDNLLTNAGKFSEPGGQITVRLETNADLHWATITVRDTGIGIEPEMLPRVFDSFAQADRTLDRSRGGLGLGLSVVKGLVELHGGEVAVRSEGLGRGTEFTVRLPWEPVPASPVTAATCPGATRSRPQRILVVEDNQDVAESLKELLELGGHEVHLAFTGPSGVAAARQLQPDVVLCDLGLPGLDGYGVAAALRQAPTTAAAHLIAVSGYGQEEDRRRCQEAGFDEHLVKPVDFAALAQLLTEMKARQR